jgi:hypothetical protein
MSETGRVSCDEVRELLATDGSERGHDHRERLRQHLSRCPACRQYSWLLQRLQEAVTEEVRDAPGPDPRHLASLHAAVRSRKPVASRWGQLLAVLGRRVPVYQVALGAAAAALVAFAALGPGHRPLGGPHALAGLDSAPQVVLTRADSDEVLVKMRRLDRERAAPGLDTLLSRYLSRHSRPAVLPSTRM